MADRKLAKWQIASIVIIVLIIPFIIVFQLTRADIVLTFDEDFKNQCFFGQPVCVYDKIIRTTLEIITEKQIEFQETGDDWRILGEDVFCIKTERTVAEPVRDPVGVITEETEVSCIDIAVFNKSDWDLTIDFLVPDEEGNLKKGFTGFSIAPPPDGSVNRFTFTMKGI